MLFFMFSCTVLDETAHDELMMYLAGKSTHYVDFYEEDSCIILDETARRIKPLDTDKWL